MAFKKKEKSETAEQPVVAKDPVQFFCYQISYSFALNDVEIDPVTNTIVKDSRGLPVPIFITDAEGNNKRRKHTYYHFDRIPVKNPKTGRTDPIQSLCTLIIAPDDPLYEDKVAHLTKQTRNPFTKVVTFEQYHKDRNPEAFALAQKEALMVEENKSLKDELAYYKSLAEDKTSPAS